MLQQNWLYFVQQHGFTIDGARAQGVGLPWSWFRLTLVDGKTGKTPTLVVEKIPSNPLNQRCHCEILIVSKLK
jgi:hypothetical protein